MLTKGAWAKVFRTSGRIVRALGNFLMSQTHPGSLLSFVVSPSPCCLRCLPMQMSVLDYQICRKEGKRKTPSKLFWWCLKAGPLG